MLLPSLHYYSLLTALFSLLSLSMQAGSVLTSSKPTPHQRPPEEYYRICPLPKCKTCATAKQILAPGVGFALEMGYGTAAIRLHNGSSQTITYVNGGPSYNSLLRRLASGPQNRIPDDTPSAWETLLYLKERAQRIFNKALGRPATPETAILADLISMLKTETEAALGGGQKVTAAVLSSPGRVRLTAEEITDVFDYLRIRNLMAVPDTLEDLYATSSAYAGFGMGLCEQYTDPYACEREESQFPTRWLLHLDFALDSLSGTIQMLQGVRVGSMQEAFIDPELGLRRLDGLNQKSDLESGDERAYWTAVVDRIRALVRSYKPQITQLILTGPAASDPRFKAAIKDALWDLVMEDTLRILDDEGGTQNLTFATARGAAEIAKRRQEGPVRCVEREECKRVRERLERQKKTEAMAEL